MPILLELFSGTGSIGKAFRAKGWEVISIDIDPKTDCTICMDIRDLTPAQLPAHPDLIWASPVCTHFSRARTTAKTPRDLEWADSLVQAVLTIAAQLRVPAFFENPESGLLKHRRVVEGKSTTAFTTTNEQHTRQGSEQQSGDSGRRGHQQDHYARKTADTARGGDTTRQHNKDPQEQDNRGTDSTNSTQYHHYSARKSQTGQASTFSGPRGKWQRSFCEASWESPRLSERAQC
jgi:hypothetical protein